MGFPILVRWHLYIELPHWPQMARWLIAWRHQAITFTNVDLSSMESCGIHPTPISQEVFNISILKITFTYLGDRWVKCFSNPTAMPVYTAGTAPGVKVNGFACDPRRVIPARHIRRQGVNTSPCVTPLWSQNRLDSLLKRRRLTLLTHQTVREARSEISASDTGLYKKNELISVK